MAIARLRIRRQITIPKGICNRLQLDVGDFIEVTIEDSKIVMIPQRLATKSLNEPPEVEK